MKINPPFVWIETNLLVEVALLNIMFEYLAIQLYSVGLTTPQFFKTQKMYE